MKDKTIRIPYFTCWPLKKAYPPDDVAVMVPPSKAVEWALCRIMGDCFLAGREIFFHPYSKLIDLSMEDDKLNPLPFFLGSLVSRIKTNDRRTLKSLLYDFGEFEMETEVERVTSLNDLLPLFFSYPSFHYEDTKINLPINSEETNLWNRIFDIGESFNKFSIYWIEDQTRSVTDMGIETKSGKDNSINLFIISRDNDGKIAAKSKKPSTHLTDIKNELNSIIKPDRSNILDGFSIFIIDMYFDLLEKEKKPVLHIFGDDFIESIRDNEKEMEPVLKSLVVVYTGGDSPFIISRSKSLNADLVIFKQIGERTAQEGHGTTSPEGRFFLLWSLYWPLVILKHTCLRLKDIRNKVKKISKNQEKTKADRKFILQLLKISKTEIAKICPPGLFYFKRDWTLEVNRILNKWIVILSSTINVFDKSMREELRDDFEKLLNQASFKNEN